MYNYLDRSTMNAIAYSSLRAKLATFMKRVCANHEPVIVTRRNAEPVVMMSLKDYEAMEETAYLLRNPANALRLLKSIRSLDAGRARARKLQD